MIQKTLKIEIYGKVQGVAMRQTLKGFADSLNLVGSVANQDDGSVVIIVQGSEGEVTQFVNFCKQGSSLARVDEVVLHNSPEINDTNFRIL